MTPELSLIRESSHCPLPIRCRHFLDLVDDPLALQSCVHRTVGVIGKLAGRSNFLSRDVEGLLFRSALRRIIGRWIVSPLASRSSNVWGEPSGGTMITLYNVTANLRYCRLVLAQDSDRTPGRSHCCASELVGSVRLTACRRVLGQSLQRLHQCAGE